MAKQETQKEQQATTTQNNIQGTSQSPATQGSTAQGGGQASSQTGMTRREQSTPSLFGSSPFTFMRRFSEEMDRLFEDFGFSRGWLTPSLGHDLWPSRSGEFSQSLWSPQVEVFEREGQLVVRADLPGLSKDDVKVEVTDDAIMITGERRQEHEEKREGYYHSERSYGTFRRSIPLPEGVNADNANATFRNGVLEITMQAPQRAERRSRQLEIQEGSGGAEQSGGKAQAAGSNR
jgi:HSP20 family protein